MHGIIDFNFFYQMTDLLRVNRRRSNRLNQDNGDRHETSRQIQGKEQAKGQGKEQGKGQKQGQGLKQGEENLLQRKEQEQGKAQDKEKSQAPLQRQDLPKVYQGQGKNPPGLDDKQEGMPQAFRHRHTGDRHGNVGFD